MRLRDSITAMFGIRSRMVEHIDASIDFISCVSVGAGFDRLREELEESTADKIIVACGFSSPSPMAQEMHAFSAEEVAGCEFLYNSSGSFGWLLKVCEYARETRHRQIIVSQFPRHWNPPKIKWVQPSYGPNLIALADGSHGGPVYEVDASACSEFMNNPSRITLNVIEDDDGDSTLALYFLGLRASSYYREVQASQGSPPRQLDACKVISIRDSDADLDTATIKRLRRAHNPRRHSEILRQASQELEQFCTSSAHGREKAAFNGGLMVPTFPESEKLPLGVSGSTACFDETVQQVDAGYSLELREYAQGHHMLAFSISVRGPATGLRAARVGVSIRSQRAGIVDLMHLDIEEPRLYVCLVEHPEQFGDVDPASTNLYSGDITFRLWADRAFESSLARIPWKSWVYAKPGSLTPESRSDARPAACHEIGFATMRLRYTMAQWWIAGRGDADQREGRRREGPLSTDELEKLFNKDQGR